MYKGSRKHKTTIILGLTDDKTGAQTKSLVLGYTVHTPLYWEIK